MADDWVDKYLKSWSQDAQRREISLRRARLVDQGASRFFDDLSRRVKKDIETFQSFAKDPDLLVVRQPGRFSVTRNNYPMPKLEVLLNGPTIEYVFSCRVDRSQAEFQEDKRGQISLDSDLSGNVQARVNGRLLADDSELSEFLLTPLFNCLKDRGV